MYGGFYATVGPYTKDMCITGCEKNPVFNPILNCGPFMSPAFALISKKPKIAECIVDIQSQMKQCINQCDLISSPKDLTIPNINQKLDTIDKLMIETQKTTNQYIDKMNHITGLNCGDTHTTSSLDVDSIINSITNVATKTDIGTNILDMINDNSLNANANEIKCRLCGCIWEKKYLLQNKLYWCQMCSIGHVFSPHMISDFAPFNDINDLIQLRDEIKNQHLDVYDGHQGYWIN